MMQQVVFLDGERERGSGEKICETDVSGVVSFGDLNNGDGQKEGVG